eukprot:361579-Ditylum_brightwellii.AAC.1
MSCLLLSSSAGIQNTEGLHAPVIAYAQSIKTLSSGIWIAEDLQPQAPTTSAEGLHAQGTAHRGNLGMFFFNTFPSNIHCQQAFRLHTV